MKNGLSETQRAIRDTFRKFADEKLKPIAADIDLKKEFPRDAFQAVGKLGFFGMRYPEEDGGSGLDMLSYCLAVEELARGSLSVAAACTMQSLMGTHFLQRFGSPELKERLFAPALRGEKIGTICITEPNAGSDLSSIATKVRREGDNFVLNGQKMWITSAPVADFFTVFARYPEAEEVGGPTGDKSEKTDGRPQAADRRLQAAGRGEEDEGAAHEKQKESRGLRGTPLSIFLVEKGTRGLNVGRTIEKMGVWASVTSEVSFDDCKIPVDHLLGEAGKGEEYLREILAKIRVMTGALAVGVGQAALEDSIAYAKQRVQFGRPIGKFQAVQMRLADMATDLEAARCLVHRAAQLIDQAEASHQQEAAMAKLFASEAAMRVCDGAARIFASYGYAMEYPVQRYLRDVRFTLIGGGTSEILKLIIARELDKPSRP